MARSLNQTLLNELAGSEMFPFFALDFTDGDTEYKYTTLDIPICLTDLGTTASGVYQPRGFEFESINYTLSNVMDNCTLRIDNLDRVLTSIFVGGTVEEKTADVYLGLITTSGISPEVLGTVQLFTGEVDSFEVDETEVRMVIGSIFTRWANQAYNKHSASCRWKIFKGTECTYSGVQPWCDRSYTRCVALENTENYGGFRFLPSIEKKKIWWGQVQS